VRLSDTWKRRTEAKETQGKQTCLDTDGKAQLQYVGKL